MELEEAAAALQGGGGAGGGGVTLTTLSAPRTHGTPRCDLAGAAGGTRFTCFTSTKVQILARGGLLLRCSQCTTHSRHSCRFYRFFFFFFSDFSLGTPSLYEPPLSARERERERERASERERESVPVGGGSLSQSCVRERGGPGGSRSVGEEHTKDVVEMALEQARAKVERLQVLNLLALLVQMHLLY